MCCHQHPENGSDLAMQNQEQITEEEYIESLKTINAQLLEALRRIHKRAKDCHLGREVVKSDSFHFHEIMMESEAAIELARKPDPDKL